MEPLTERQRQILGFIEDRLGAGEPPSQREIAAHFGLAQNAVYQLVTYLRKKGYVVASGQHRGLRLSPRYQQYARQAEGVPIVGRVAAGEPVLAEENIEGYLDGRELLGTSKGTFALKVVGDSMVDDGILDGDYVVVEPRADVGNGQIGVVLLDDEATVKRVFVQRNRIALKPANKAAGYRTRYIRKSEREVYIVGKVTACIRMM